MTVLDTGRIAVRDTELYVDVEGQGPPVLVMHGGLGVDHTCFRPWLDPLGDTASLIYYDHRGNGRSARPPLDEFDHDTWVEDADALRAAMGHEKVVVLGHSYGGFLALRYALAHPDRVRGLILLSTAAVMEHWDSIHEGLTARHAGSAAGLRGPPLRGRRGRGGLEPPTSRVARYETARARTGQVRPDAAAWQVPLVC